MKSKKIYIFGGLVLAFLVSFQNCGGGFTASFPIGASSSSANIAGTSAPANGGTSSVATTPANTTTPVPTPGPIVSGSKTAINTMRPLGKPYKDNGYWEYLPVGYGGSIKSPLMVFFHGIGENGAGDASSLPLLNANTGSIPELIADNLWPSTRPFVVLSPQHPGQDCPSPTEIFNFIQFAIGNYNIDPTRVYATGLSCGALGLSTYLGQYGNAQVAATVLVAGDATDEWNGQGCKLVKNVAVWAFHGDADPTVSIAGDNTYMPQFESCSALKSPSQKSVQYTILPGDNHQQTWIDAYSTSFGDIYTWLLQFSKSNN
jgi:predicted peptidase